MKYIKRCLSLLACLSVLSCAGDPLFVSIGDNLSGPIAIVLDTARSRAYVVNSNLNVAFEDTSLITLDIADPTAPTILDINNNPFEVPALSGQAFLDATTQRLFVTNRFSSNNKDLIDNLLVIDMTEDGDFGTLQTIEAGENPFGIACCDNQNRFYVVSDGNLEVFDLDDPTSKTTISLEITVSNGDSFSGDSTTHIALLNNQAFLTNRAGIIYVINTDKIDGSGQNPIDYLIANMNDLRGIVSDGTNLYTVEVDFEDDEVTRLRSIDLTSVPPLADISETILRIDVENDGVERQTLSVGLEPQEILLFNNRAYVTNGDSDSVTVVDITDPASMATITTIDLTSGGFTAKNPFGMAAANIGGTDYLFVTNLDSNNISIIDVASNTVVANYP